MKYIPGFQTFARHLITLTYKTVYRFKIIGRENIPEGGCFICANHPSANDPLLLLVAIDTKYELSAMAKKELFENKALSAVLTALGGFGVDRGKPDIKAIKMCLKDVEDGKKFIIFPEGTRSINSNKKAKAGIGLLTIRSGSPVVPVYIANTPKLFQKVTIIFGEPLIPPKKEEKVSSETYAQFILDSIFELGRKNGYTID